MKTYRLNTIGYRCPEPILKIAAKATEMKEGDILEVTADCPTFAHNVMRWSVRLHKTLLFIQDNGNGRMKCQIKF
jgi:tRNA 2-thiouridine synthesizing protein A